MDKQWLRGYLTLSSQDNAVQSVSVQQERQALAGQH